jgi:hypothetical protein
MRQVDECKDWADKAEALASYARQRGDDVLRKMADRIQTRAIRREGELLEKFVARRGANQNIRAGAHPKVPTRKGVAAQAGLSDRQRKTALRVAAIPQQEFEAATESDHPPSVTELARRGTKSKPKPEQIHLVDLGSRSEEQFQAATTLLGVIDELEQYFAAVDLKLALAGLDLFERKELAERAAVLAKWLERIPHAIQPQ